MVGDRIAAGTWVFAAALTRGDVTVRGFEPRHLGFVLDKLVDAGVVVDRRDDGVRVTCPVGPARST